MAAFYADYLDGIRRDGVVGRRSDRVVAEGVPPGWGAPIYGKLGRRHRVGADASINAVKGVRSVSAWARPRSPARRTPTRCGSATTGRSAFPTTMPAGILGGISSGQPVVARFAVKPTSSILTPRATIDRWMGNETEVLTKGRHDPCVGIRAVPVAEAMLRSCWRTIICGTGGRWDSDASGTTRHRQPSPPLPLSPHPAKQPTVASRSAQGIGR